MMLDYQNNDLIMTIILPQKSTDNTTLMVFKTHCCDNIQD